HAILPGPDNRLAYSPDLGIDKVVIYKLDASKGALTPAGDASVAPGSGPRHMKFGRDGGYAYVLNELLLTVSAFKRDGASGQLEPIQTLSTVADDTNRDGLSCSEIRVHPNGKFIYAATRDWSKTGKDAITVYSRANAKGFERVQIAPAAVSVPRNFNLDPSGRWLLAGGQVSKEVAVFKVDPDSGKLSFTGDKGPFEGGPICLEFLELD
ncbi:MAG: beta-propeller fold lactonase family protein, partial [Verrucomicrobiota bacterium]